MKLFIERLPRCLVLHSKGRIAMAALILAAAGLQWFTWARRNPLVRERGQEIRAIDHLGDEVKKLEKDWTEEQTAELEGLTTEITQKLFHGDPRSGGWSEEVNSPENLGNTEVRVKVGKPIAHPRFADELLVLPTVWHLGFSNENPPSVTAVLSVIHRLISNQKKRLDLVSLSVNGDGQIIKQVEIGFDLWFKKEKEE